MSLPDQTAVALARLMQTSGPILAISGAGCSAASGIPTYRDDLAVWQRNAPITHQRFMGESRSRQRYWARSFAGWPPVRDAVPNSAHHDLVTLEQRGHLCLLVTQNVDGLHQRAGHQNVIDLHGRLAEVVCTTCGSISSRAVMQERIFALNPGIAAEAHALAPDGDAEVQESIINTLTIPACSQCDGILKPNVVFYGGTVGKSIVSDVYTALEAAGAVLVVGSSLMVFSAFRFCRRAAELGKPMAIVNRGVTRADAMADIKLNMDCGQALSTLVRMIQGKDDEPTYADHH